MAIVDVDIAGLPDSDTAPKGQYRLRIDQVSEVKEDKNGDEFVNLGLSIIKGDYANKRISENYITLRKGAKLKRILRAAQFDKPRLANLEEMIGLELDAILTVKDSEEYGEQNKISVYIVPGEHAMAGKRR